MDGVTIFLIISLIAFILLLKGVIQAFKRNAVVAILCVIFIFPVFLCWAFVEIFLPAPK
ncbi:MAG: hypothetical protein ACON41_05800 [Parvibaculales bacterium]